MNRRRAKVGTRGFSLMEIMISLGVIAIALFAVFTFILNTLSAKEAMKDLETAKQAVTNKIEEIKSQEFEQVLTYATAQTVAQRTVAGLFDPLAPTQPATMTITVVGIPSNVVSETRIWDLTVQINWLGSGGTRTHRVNNLISKF